MGSAESTTGYGSLLADGRFEGFLWAQFLGAFNDNVYKMIVSFTAVRIAVDSASSGRYLALSGAVFILPYILFSGYAGQLADRYSKTRMLQVTKSLEIVTMVMGIDAEEVRIIGNFVDQDIVDETAVFVKQAGIMRLPEGESGGGNGRDMVHQFESFGPTDFDFAHVADVE